MSILLTLDRRKGSNERRGEEVSLSTAVSFSYLRAYPSGTLLWTCPSVIFGRFAHMYKLEMDRCFCCDHTETQENRIL
jgi:hypothetical protein